MASALTRAQLKAAFDKVDKDGSGNIDIGELQHLLVFCDIEPNNVTLWKMMEKLDTSIPYGQIDFEEFYDYMKKNQDDHGLARTMSAPQSAEEWSTRLDALDAKSNATAIRHDVEGSKTMTEDEVISRYPLGKKLGAGKYASVHKCTDKQTGETKAMKLFYKKNRSKKKFYDVIEEANKMRRVQAHPHIVKCFELIETQERLIMLIEYVEGGQLYDEILKRKPQFFSEQMAGKIIGELTDAIGHMHREGVIHCDLKPENVLCTVNPSTDHFDIKVADMGLSKVLEEAEKQNLTYCGTPLYMAPEMLKKEQYSYPVDLWSIGCMMHELMCGEPPFTGKNMFELERNVKGYKGLDDTAFHATKRIKSHFAKFKVSANAQDLIGRYLLPDQRTRITAEDALKHPWLANNEALGNTHMSSVHVNLQLATEKRKFRRAINKIIIAQKILKAMKGGHGHAHQKTSEKNPKAKEEGHGCSCLLM